MKCSALDRNSMTMGTPQTRQEKASHVVLVTLERRGGEGQDWKNSVAAL